MILGRGFRIIGGTLNLENAAFLLYFDILTLFTVQVPMISGRGLGITGGTLDKLESIPGYRVQLTLKVEL